MGIHERPLHLVVLVAELEIVLVAELVLVLVLELLVASVLRMEVEEWWMDNQHVFSASLIVAGAGAVEPHVVDEQLDNHC